MDRGFRKPSKFRFMLPLIIAVELLLLYFQTPNLFALGPMLNLMRQMSVLVVVAAGMSFVLIAGHIDISIGGQIALIGMVAGSVITRTGSGMALLMLLGILLGILLGMANGFLVTRLRMHPFIITLAMSVIYRGLARTVNGGMPLYHIADHFGWLFNSSLWIVPTPLAMAVLGVFASHNILKRTVFGRFAYAVGDNAEVAELAGIDTRRLRLRAYMLAGAFMGTASMLGISRVGTAQPNAETDIEMTMLSAAALGGVSLAGGRGRPTYFVAGILILELLGILLINMNIAEHYRSIIKGVILLIAIAVDKK